MEELLLTKLTLRLVLSFDQMCTAARNLGHPTIPDKINPVHGV